MNELCQPLGDPPLLLDDGAGGPNDELPPIDELLPLLNEMPPLDELLLGPLDEVNDGEDGLEEEPLPLDELLPALEDGSDDDEPDEDPDELDDPLLLPLEEPDGDPLDELLTIDELEQHSQQQQPAW